MQCKGWIEKACGTVSAVKMFKRGIKMQSGQIKLLQTTATAFLLFTAGSIVLSEEKVIQQEKISYEKCLNVIATSEDKLSIAPQIEDIADQKRVALFKLADGTLTITCDGQEGTVTVSTNTN